MKMGSWKTGENRKWIRFVVSSAGVVRSIRWVACEQLQCRVYVCMGCGQLQCKVSGM